MRETRSSGSVRGRPVTDVPTANGERTKLIQPRSVTKLPRYKWTTHDLHSLQGKIGGISEHTHPDHIITLYSSPLSNCLVGGLPAA